MKDKQGNLSGFVIQKLLLLGYVGEVTKVEEDKRFVTVDNPKEQEHYKYKKNLKIFNLFFFVFFYQKAIIVIYIEKTKER